MRTQPCLVVFVIATLPLLQGAGCRTHYSARLQGEVEVAEELTAAHEGAEVRIVYRDLAPDDAPCEDWDACLLEGSWHPLRPCDALSEGEGHTTAVTVSAGDRTFDACTSMVGVDYRADVAAFVDLDGDGEPSAGEPYGAYRGGPVTRGAAESAVAIRIDDTLPE